MATIGDPWPFRFGAWLLERFPPGPYTALVLAFHLAAVAVARAGGDGTWAPAAAVVAWLVFLHLRLLDEHKDFEADRLAYPDRVLSRGIVTLSSLGSVLALVLMAEAVIALSISVRAFVAWAAVLAFSAAMRFEFGAAEWLRERIVAYAITHNPIIAALCMFLWAASGAAWDWRFLGFVALASFGSLGFEFGRKIRLPEEEHIGVPSYSSELGQRESRQLLGVVHAATALSLTFLVASLGRPGLGLVGGLAVAAVGIGLTGGKSKRVELGASLVLLGSLALAGIAGWLAW